MTDDQHPWASALPELHTQVWARLIRGVHDRHAVARNMMLATVGLDGAPQARTVVLRAADRQAAVLEIHTDLRSHKVAELRSNSRAALHVWDASVNLQMRLTADVAILTGQDVTAIWAKVPDPSRHSYGSTPAPGQPIAQALGYAKDADAACFAVLRFRIQSIDALNLERDHRRARFDRADGWRGGWLAT